MSYLVGQMLTCLLLASLLGLFIGWFWWGMRLRHAREHATDLEQRVSKLSGYPARLTDMEATHAAYVASKNEEEAKTKARIAELEKGVADKTAEGDGLRSQLTSKANELSTLQNRFNDIEVQHTSVSGAASQVPDLTAKLQTSTARVGELEGLLKTKDAQLATLSGRVPQLEDQLAAHVDANKEKDEHLEQLMAQVDGLKSQVSQHESLHVEKDATIASLGALAALVPGLKGQAEQHTAALAEKEAKLAELNKHLESNAAWIQGLHGQAEQHATALADRDAKIAELSKHLESNTAWIQGLHGQAEQHATALADKDAQIGQHTAAHAEKDAKIAELAALAALVPELKSQVEQRHSHIASLTTQVDEHKGTIADLRSQLEESHTHLASLQSTDAVYEHNLTTRKLKMAEAGLVAHQAEIAKLNDQILMHKAEIERASQQQPRAMAAAAGAGAAAGFVATAPEFYDVNEGNGAGSAVAEKPDHVREFETRIDELRHSEAAKDAELDRLRSRLQEIESAPDPDAKRQLLYTAKNAELTHLRTVLNSLMQPVNSDDVARRAYSYAKERNFEGGSEREDWLRAEREIHNQRLAEAWETTRGANLY